MTKEEFKQLRAEAGFKTDTEFAKALNISVLNVNSWNMGINKYPSYLKNVLFLFKLYNNFDIEQYNNFLFGLKPKQKIKKEDREFIKNAKLILKDKTLEELKLENKELKQQIKFLQNLILEL